MLFLLEAVCKKGFISKIEREERAVGGVRAAILRLCVARRGGRRRIEKLLDGMASAICAQAEGRAVYREDFPFSRELAERGVCEAGERELYKAKAVEILSAAAERKERLFVAFDKSDAGLSDTLRKSAARFRYIEAEAPPDAQAGPSGTGDLLRQTLAMARSIGVQADIRGSLPQDPARRILLARAIQECAANAVKHAEGDRLDIRLDENEGNLLIRISNNGKPPKGPVTESGGLLSLRRSVEEAKGSMAVESTPAFALILRLPANP